MPCLPVSLAAKPDISDAEYEGLIFKYIYAGFEIEQENMVIRYGGKTLSEDVDYSAEYENNTNVGTAVLTVKGIGEYTGSYNIEYEILPRSISDFTFSDIADVAYSGEEITISAPRVLCKTKKPSGEDYEYYIYYGTDYEFSYKNNINVGEATLTVSGIGNFEGEKELNFNIVPADISGAVFGDIEPQIYTGSAIKPSFALSFNGKALESGTDYTYSYISNINAGTASIKVTGKGNFIGTKTASFTILPLTVSEFVISEIAEQVYTGSAITPAVTVKYNGKVLTKGTDYSVSYSSNTNVGTAYISVTGKGNYSGNSVASFDIIPADASAFTVSAVADQKYTGSAITPELTVKFAGKTLVKNTDYTVSYTSNTEIGTAYATINGKGNFKGSKAVSFKIIQASASEFTVLDVANQKYTGSAVTPEITVMYGKKTLVKNTDYTLSYSSNINVGIASVTINGIGKYSGTISASFKIVPENASEFTVSEIADKTYTGSAITPSVTVTFNGKALAKNTDYTVSYSSNTNVGTAVVTISGKGNFTGSTSVSFNILPAAASSFTVSEISDQEYTSSEIAPDFTVKFGSKLLEEGADYTVEYINNTDIGSAQIVITGKGNFRGSKTVSFNIVEKIVLNKIELDKSALSLRCKALGTLKVSPVPENAELGEIKWKSSNPATAKVDANGKVTAIRRGTATITAETTNEDGTILKADCKVTVYYEWWQWVIIIVLFGWIWYI